MLWFLLLALACAGGHWLSAIFYAAVALSANRHGKVVIVTRAVSPPPTPPSSAYDIAAARQRGRRIRLVK